MGMQAGSNDGRQSGWGMSNSLAKNRTKSSSSVWGAQGSFLKGLFDDASQLADSQSGIQDYATGKYEEQRAGLDAATGSLSEMARTGGPVSAFADPNNDLARRQVDDMSASIGENFRREIMPGIRSSAGAVGGMGGSREALARGVAAGDASRAISSAATDIYGTHYQTAASAAEAAGNNRLTAAGALPGAAAASYQMSMAPYEAAWSPINSLAQALGGPTVLNKSRGRSKARSVSENRTKGSSSGSNWGFSLF